MKRVKNTLIFNKIVKYLWFCVKIILKKKIGNIFEEIELQSLFNKQYISQQMCCDDDVSYFF